MMLFLSVVWREGTPTTACPPYNENPDSPMVPMLQGRLLDLSKEFYRLRFSGLLAQRLYTLRQEIDLHIRARDSAV